MSKVYKVKPLVWIHVGTNSVEDIAPTYFDDYFIMPESPGRWRWQHGESPLMGRTGVESTVADAKLAAEQHWHDRIAAALEEVGTSKKVPKRYSMYVSIDPISGLPYVESKEDDCGAWTIAAGSEWYEDTTGRKFEPQ